MFLLCSLFKTLLQGSEVQEIFLYCILDIVFGVVFLFFLSLHRAFPKDTESMESNRK